MSTPTPTQYRRAVALPDVHAEARARAVASFLDVRAEDLARTFASYGVEADVRAEALARAFASYGAEALSAVRAEARFRAVALLRRPAVASFHVAVAAAEYDAEDASTVYDAEYDSGDASTEYNAEDDAEDAAAEYDFEDDAEDAAAEYDVEDVADDAAAALAVQLPQPLEPRALVVEQALVHPSRHAQAAVKQDALALIILLLLLVGPASVAVILLRRGELSLLLVARNAATPAAVRGGGRCSAGLPRPARGSLGGENVAVALPLACGIGIGNGIGIGGSRGSSVGSWLCIGWRCIGGGGGLCRLRLRCAVLLPPLLPLLGAGARVSVRPPAKQSWMLDCTS